MCEWSVVGGPGVRTATKRAGHDDYVITDAQPTSALQPPTVKKSAPSAITEHLDKHVPVTEFHDVHFYLHLPHFDVSCHKSLTLRVKCLQGHHTSIIL